VFLIEYIWHISVFNSLFTFRYKTSPTGAKLLFIDMLCQAVNIWVLDMASQGQLGLLDPDLHHGGGRVQTQAGLEQVLLTANIVSRNMFCNLFNFSIEGEGHLKDDR
jgi:hypothetical protein